MKKFLGFLLTLGVVIATATFANNSVSNTTWLLTSYNGSVATGTLSFDETTMLSRFCNNVRQGYSLSGNMLYSVGQAMSTMMYCEGMPMTLENNFIISSTGTSLILSGDTLTITANNNSYSFIKNLIKLDNLVSQCIQAYDQCGNMCHRAAGATDWSCTKMTCNMQKDAQCIMSTDDEPVLCTMEYNPVCGSKQVQCITAPCNPVQQTYSNICMMNSDKATLVHTGACEDIIVGNDKDSHGCVGSAGYSWSQSKNECTRAWEYNATELEKAYDLAYNNGITTMDTLKSFRADDLITRQEAAKMFVVFAEKVLGKVREKGFSSECNETFDNSGYGSKNGIDDIDHTLVNFLVDACKANIMKGGSIPHGNGAKSFRPFSSLTRAQSLAILMRAVDGWQEAEKTSEPRWMPYADRADQLGYMTFANFKGFEDAITRGELIEWIYAVYLKKNNNYKS